MGFKDEQPTLIERLTEVADNHAAIGAEGDAQDVRDAIRVVVAAVDLADFYRDRSRHITVSRVIGALEASAVPAKEADEEADDA
jgi:hypothetical protein